jgi:glycosyltransferase involved in cell wall biosynthesis
MSVAGNKPLVSIGMPVYNGERFIRRALDSLLAQDYKNFELIISDNASIDKTQEICLEYAARDARIRYFRNEKNMGSAWNFQRVFELSSGKYFMWAAADDWREPTFISKCIEILEHDPTVVLAYPLAVLIDEDGQEYGLMAGRLDTRDWDSPVIRGIFVMLGIQGNEIYGLIRADALRRCKPIRATLGADIITLFELSLIGKFAHISEPLFYRLRIRKGETWDKRHRRWLDAIDPKNKGKRVYFPYWKMAWGYIDAVLHASLCVRHKLFLLGAVIMIVPWKMRRVLLKVVVMP